VAHNQHKLEPGDALLIIDVQCDFLPGGSLAVPHGDQVVPVLNQVIANFERAGLPIFASRDWHPANHCSFKDAGGLWPPHCIQGTQGATFAPCLRLPPGAAIVSKDVLPDCDTYSAFQQTDLAERLRGRGIERVVTGGLATDYCVLCSVRDALAKGFQVCVLVDAVRAVDVQPRDGERALEEMRRCGAQLIESSELIG
jgi:nicotinamidase/pyrazinamidase